MDLHSVWITHHAKQVPYVELKKNHFFVTSDISTTTQLLIYVGCPESIQPFYISQESIAWPLCNLAASQRRSYCAFMNNHSPMGLVSWQ
jgi:hypothetical protein